MGCACGRDRSIGAGRVVYILVAPAAGDMWRERIERSDVAVRRVLSPMLASARGIDVLVPCAKASGPRISYAIDFARNVGLELFVAGEVCRDISASFAWHCITPRPRVQNRLGQQEVLGSCACSLPARQKLGDFGLGPSSRAGTRSVPIHHHLPEGKPTSDRQPLDIGHLLVYKCRRSWDPCDLLAWCNASMRRSSSCQNALMLLSF